MVNSMAAANWFLALVVPEQAGLSRLLADLPDSVRPFAAADLHITVAFLGPCGQERALRAWQAIAPLRHPAIAVVSGGWRAMGPPDNPSAYALTVEPDPDQNQRKDDNQLRDRGRNLTAALIERWRQPALKAAGLPPERRAALPHITLARPRRRGLEQERAGIEAWLQQASGTQASSPQAPRPQHHLILREIALYTWDDDRQHQLFRLETRRPLDQGGG